MADWLLTHCPFSTLTLLTLLVIGSAVNVTRPWLVLSAAVLADLGLSSLRVARRRRHSRVKPIPRRAPA